MPGLNAGVDARVQVPKVDYDPFINSLVIFTQFTLGPYVVQVWLRSTLDVRGNKIVALHRDTLVSRIAREGWSRYRPNLGKERHLSRANIQVLFYAVTCRL